MKHLTSLLAIALGLVCVGNASSATWTPIASGGKLRTLEVNTTSVIPVPSTIATRGGNIRFTLVGGGEGGHAANGSCDDYATQGGKGGDGGEVIELDVNVQPGQCAAGFGLVIGTPGRGALRSGNGSLVGEPGGQTTLSCSGVVLATALGGGRRADVFTAPRSAKGGAGGALINTMDAATAVTTDQRSTSSTPGSDGQAGRNGYGSGGGGGGASLSLTGTMVKADGTVVRKAMTRHAPIGKAGYGAGSGAGAVSYSSDSAFAPAENAVQYGAGGGGGAAACGGATAPRDAGNGFQGLIKVQWQE